MSQFEVEEFFKVIYLFGPHDLKATGKIYQSKNEIKSIKMRRDDVTPHE